MGSKREEAWPSDEKETQEGYERNKERRKRMLRRTLHHYLDF